MQVRVRLWFNRFAIIRGRRFVCHRQGAFLAGVFLGGLSFELRAGAWACLVALPVRSMPAHGHSRAVLLERISLRPHREVAP